jgi:hypothetical protein
MMHKIKEENIYYNYYTASNYSRTFMIIQKFFFLKLEKV